MVGLALKQEGVDPRVAPLLFGRTWTVPCAPGRHATIIGAANEAERHTGSVRLLFEGLGSRENTTESLGIARCPRFHVGVRLETHVGPRVFPTERTEPFYLGHALALLFLC